MKNIQHYILPIFLPAIVCSCKKFVDIPVPQDRIIAVSVFEDSAKATSAVTAIYGTMINGSTSLYNSYATVSGGFSSDELQKFNPTVTEQELLNNVLSPANTFIKGLWANAYQVIYYSNAILEGLAKSPTLPESVRNKLTGECKFIRALSYFYLINYFGKVPFITSTDYSVNSRLPRSPIDEVCQLIESDLLYAKQSLPLSYTGGEKTRPIQYAAATLLARFYLFRERWTEAESAATDIINSGLYTPLPTTSVTFLKNNKEAIWQLIPTAAVLKETQQFRPTGTTTLIPQVILSNGLMNAFENNDQRKKWIDSLTYLSIKYYYPSKYKNTSTAVTEYYTVLRAAELFLLRAEARAMTNNINGAKDDINVIRNRAGLPLTTASDKNSMLAAIEQERRIEYFAEWGHRWFDLKRTGRAEVFLPLVKPGWKNTAKLFPVPTDELIANSNLDQNDGY